MNIKAPAVYIAVFVVLLVAGRTVIMSDGSRMTAASNALGLVFSPARAAQKYLCGVFDDIRLYSKSKASLVRKAKELEKENLRLRNLAVISRSDKSRIAELEELLKIKSFTAFDTVSADVMYHSASSWFHTFTVNAGTEDRVSIGDAVFNASGLIGQVVETGKNMSVVSSITEGSSSVGGMIDRSGTKGLVQGSYSGFLFLNYLPSDADVKKG
ncbi:MAG: rod shape-determining protein MreC, partial [Abditibacteriota bacterium]|nr:rod shape-determining protein MreC [Abditibacteriota bacterium]